MSVVRATMLVGGSRIVCRGLALVRTVVFARLLSPADLGVAATIWLTVTLLEMTSNLAADRIIVQDRDGDAPCFLGAAHLVQVARGVLGAAVLLAAAGPVTALFGIPEARDAFRVMAAWPLVRGLAHLDVKRLHRSLTFRPDIGTEVAAQVAALALSWPVAAWLGTYWAVVWVAVAQAAVHTAASHMVAERPYRWSADRRRLAQMAAFGWPLLLNGLLMFGIFQGDHFVIASARGLFGTDYSMADLGAYAVAFTLATAPTVVLAQVNSALMLPTLSSVQDAPGPFARAYRTSAQALATAAALVASFLVLVGPALVVLVYGAEYARGATVIGWLAVMQAIRVLRAAPSMAAMARGDTLNMLLANLGRSLALPVMLGIAALALDLTWIAAAGAGGEALGLLIASGRLRARHGLPLSAVLRPAVVPALAITAAAVIASSTGTELAPALLAWALLAPVILLVAAVTCTDLRHHAATTRRARSGGAMPLAPEGRR